jgi:hypothetical protein
MQESLKVNSEQFKDLYLPQPGDETIISFRGEDIGFSLVRLYPQDTLYYKDGKRIFLKLALIKEGLFWSVEMTTPQEEEGKRIYVISEGEEYKKRVTNFFSDKSDPFVFDFDNKKILHAKSGKSFSVNEFVDILVFNHLSDRMAMKRILNFLVETLLMIIFWLIDKRYDKIRVSVDLFHVRRGKKVLENGEKNTEPFFKYFSMSRNMVFALLALSFFIAIPIQPIWSFGEFTLSNPFIVLSFLLLLFIGEKVSQWLEKQVDRFFNENEEQMFDKPKINFIKKLHEYQYRNKFELRLKTINR